MSSRAMRAMRGDAHALFLNHPENSEEEGGDERSDEDEFIERQQPSTFAMAFHDEDDDESSEDSEPYESNTEPQTKFAGSDNVANVSIEPVVDAGRRKANARLAATENDHATEEKEEEDLDVILSEFRALHSHPGQEGANGGIRKTNHSLVPASPSSYHVILQNLNVRDLDFEKCLRSALLSEERTSEAFLSLQTQDRRRRLWLFGSPHSDWPAPPKYMGGGMGMKTYAELDQPVPWPYSHLKASAELPTCWFQFVHSDTYQQDSRDFDLIRDSGDLQSLVFFVIHHPFYCPALLQLSSILYQTNHSQRGLAILRRCLWIYESSALISFFREHLSGRSMALMDAEKEENQPFFQAMKLLIRVARMAGLPHAALAVSRLALSLDPLRDPLAVLLSLDYFCLSTQSSAHLRWLIQLVDSNVIRLYHRREDGTNNDEDDLTNESLLALPNWSFSYALAKFLLSGSESLSVEEQQDYRKEADEALRHAIQRFPSITEKLLQANGIDIRARSFRRDWPCVLEFDRVRSERLLQQWRSPTTPNASTLVSINSVCKTLDRIIRLFVQQNSHQWNSDAILDFLYENLCLVQQLGEPGHPHSSEARVELPFQGLLRYCDLDVADYEASIPQLPPEANEIDAGLLDQALLIDPHRGRLLRRHRQHGNAENEWWEGRDEIVGGRQGTFLDQWMGDIDPDLPLLEVFWRSFLPWNRVMGVAPPAR